MTTALAGAVELLERSLGYTRVVLGAARGADLSCPTPCRDWTLADLLAHMEDALDAFTEAACGALGTPPRPVAPQTPRLDRIRDKACALLGAWSAPPPEGVDVGGHAVASDLLLSAAALEITVHGWDVATSLGLDRPLPDPLAEQLLDLARVLVQPSDRVVRFDWPRAVPDDAGPGERLLAHLGR